MFRGNQRRVFNESNRRGAIRGNVRTGNGQRHVWSTGVRNADGTRTWVRGRQLRRIVDYVNAVSRRGGSNGGGGGC